MRHPFLLSLERIEISEGRLFVVTELADASLRDRMQECLNEGLPGIPRAELLRHLREAAEALDYLSSNFELQHLDIKPENVLLLAGHVKVADFGLVKQVERPEASLVGGLTPSYAAPEVYQGNPSRFSDQYSLAILYQEMLTGMLPFAGSTVAELTLQHLHNEPNLDSLDEDDRYVISQALAKESSHRFANCCAMVDALSRQTSTVAPSISTKPVVRTSNYAVATRRDVDVTQLFDDDCPVDNASMWLTLPEIAAPVLVEPKQDFASDFAITPTLIIGIGSTGEHVLRAYRRRVVQLVGTEGLDAAQRMLLIDSEPRSIARSVCPDGVVRGLRADETLCIPLSHPSEYREKADRLLTWLSRRWLYNIPKSLRTDGLRPLGRLTLIDHARQVVQRIRMSVADMLDADHLIAAGERLARPIRARAVHVRLVGSIAGGTASGMLIDLAYVVRALLSRFDLDDVRVSAVVTHSTGSDTQRNELARVNSFAWLNEYEHFRSPENAYPGDTGGGLPAHEASVAPVDQLHVIDLGTGLDDAGIARATGTVGDYLAAATLLPVESALAPNAERCGALATFRLQELPLGDEQERRQIERSVFACLKSLWLAKPLDGEPIDHHGNRSSTTRIEALIGEQRLDAAGLLAKTQCAVADYLGGASPLELLKSKLSVLGIARDQLSFDVGRELVEEICCVEMADGEDEVTCMEGRLDALAEQVSTTTATWLLAELDQPAKRLPACDESLSCLADHFSELTIHFDALQKSIAERLLAITGASGEAQWPDSTDRVVAFLRLRSEQLIARLVGRLLEKLLSRLVVMGDRLTKLRARLRTAFERLSSSDESATSPALGPATEPSAEQQLAAQRLAEDVDAHWKTPIQFASLDVWMLDGKGLEEFPKAIALAVERCVQRHIARKFAERSLVADTAQGFALPTLSSQGGELRHLAIVPHGVPVSAIVGDTRSCKVAVIEASGLDGVLMIAEISALSALHTAAAFVNSRRDYAEFASRAYCRADIHWSSLLDRLTNTALGLGVPFSDVPPATPIAFSVQSVDSQPLGLATIN